MSESYPIECPHCHAKGNLADASLLGQAICCPTCQQVFVAPLPVNPAVPVPVVTVPVIPVPTPVPEVLPTAAVSVPPIEVPPVAAVEVLQPVQVPQSPSVAASSPPPATTWKFGAASEEVLATSAAPVVTVAIAPVIPPPIDVTSVAAAPVVSAMPMQATPVPTAPAVAYAPPPIATGMPQEFPAQTVPGQAILSPVVPGQVAPPAVGQFPVQLVAPAPTGHYLPAEPFAGVVLPAVHNMDGPVPGFMAPAPPPGPAELSFAQSLPEPVARGAIQPPKPTSKANQNLIIGGISAILLFATIVFLMGDPFRRFGKTKPPEEPAEMNPIAKPYVPQPGDTTAEDAFARINALNNPKPDKK